LFLSLLFAAGCAHAPGPAQTPSLTAADYYPLALGNRWTYRADLLGQTHDETVEIEGKKDGFFVDNHKGMIEATGAGVRDQHRFLLKNPIAEGTKWKNVVSVTALESYEITRADFPCEVPAGSFLHCVTVESRNRTSQATLVNQLTFAPHVGIVRLETLAEVNGQRIPQASLVLTSFAVK
jgi:hypothetical protein